MVSGRHTASSISPAPFSKENSPQLLIRRSRKNGSKTILTVAVPRLNVKFQRSGYGVHKVQPYNSAVRFPPDLYSVQRVSRFSCLHA